jgi:adenylate cyclase
MLDRLAALNAQRAREAESDGHPFLPLRIGIGLNTGPCFVGNFGSDLHFNYSVLGDTVNVSSRLESQCKTYGVPIILGARTAEAAASRFAVLELDTLQVVGKSAPERIFTLLGREDVAASPDFRELAITNQMMLTAYRRGDWAQAIERLLRGRDIARHFGLEAYHAVMVERIRRLMEAPPSTEWRGVTVLETK